MSQRSIREHTFKILFTSNFHTKEEMDEQCESYFSHLPDASVEKDSDKLPAVEEEEQIKILKKVEAITQVLEAIDEKLEKNMQGWKISRLNQVDLALLRLAIYEFEFSGDVPYKVAVNEAIELAKKYGGDESPQFVNGVLAHMVKKDDHNKKDI